MVDDIRPREPKQPEDQNKDFVVSESEIKESAPLPTDSKPEPEEEFPGIKPEPTSDQEGFVVVPNGKDIGKNPFAKLGGKIKHLSKKQKFIALGILLAVLLLAGGGVYALTKKDPPPPPPPIPVVEQKAEEPPKPTTEASKLTGIQVQPEINKRPVTSIQIENSPDARPQSGLLQAGVVFEAIAEGGITRFNASFLETQPDYIGPIRSVRPYYAELAAPFDPIFVHAGGSAAGLAKLKELGIKDFDHGANGGAFQRVSSRYAPHNLYSSTAAIDAGAAARGYTSSDAKSFLRKEEKKGQTPTAATINMTLSSPLYNVTYTYDASSNTYLRTLGGKPHTDERTGQQLAPKVVIAMVSSFSQNGIYSVYQTTGTNQVFIFQDGQVQQGTWEKASAKDQIVFKDASGQQIGIDPGQTWITLIKDPGQVAFTP